MMSIGEVGKCRWLFTRLIRANNARLSAAPASGKPAPTDFDQLEKLHEEEQKRLEEDRIEKLRDKSGLQPQHYNIQHGQKPYEEKLYHHQETLGYKRRMYGRYGISSQVNPSILWPSADELKAIKEYESVAHPHTLPELIEIVKKQREEEEEAKRKREEEILEKVKTRKDKIQAFTNKIRKKVMQAYEMKKKKERMVTEIRAKIGYDIDVRHARYQEELQKMEEEARQKAKMEKKEAKEKRKLDKQKLLSQQFEESLEKKASDSD